MARREATKANGGDLGTPGSRPRQSPGFACQECRAKKIRCDRKQPCCVCVDAGVQCRFDATHPPRGPQRGFLKVLRSRIATLERRLGDVPEDNPGVTSLKPLDTNTNNEQTNDNDNDNDNDSSVDIQSVSRNDIMATSGEINFGEQFDVNDSGDWNSTAMLPNNFWEMADKGIWEMPDFLSTPPHSFPNADTDIPQATSATPTVNHIPGMPGLKNVLPTPPHEPAMTKDALSALSRADLDQLYFDRVHPFVPILRRSRFLSRSKQPICPPSYVCKQYAAWTMAAALSSQFHDRSHSLYLATLEKFKALDFAPQTPSTLPTSNENYGQVLVDNEISNLDQAQAWMLIALYEFMQDAFQRAWASAGRAIRLVQYMRLNVLDTRDASSGQAEASSSSIAFLEEKRRTFWMAFCLDRFSCILGGIPLTLNEHLVSTRLPSPEQAYQGGVHFQMPFLSEIVCTNKAHDAANVGLSSISSSPFVECIIFTMLWGRALEHQQYATVHHIQGNIAPVFRERHLAFDGILSNELMVAQAIVLSLCIAAETMPKNAEGYGDFVAGYRQRAHTATKELARLSKCLLQHSLFKVHPFTPIPLDLCRKTLLSLQDPDASMKEDLGAITTALQYLKDVNTMCQRAMDFDTSGIMDFEADFLVA